MEMASSNDLQGTLFDLPPRQLDTPPENAEHVALAAALPPSIYLGALTWTFAGWIGLVYGAGTPERQLAAHGLTAYARHPLLRMVEIDRPYYEPLPVPTFRDYAQQVPADFRFFVKAHEDCTVVKFPGHARYGRKKNQENPRFLDAEYATAAVVEPAAEGLGDKLGGLLFQFSPQDLGPPRLFAERLHGFLRRLPKGPTYAVELRNAEQLTRDYAAALEDAGAIHCHNRWTYMPSVLTQVRRIPPGARRPLVVRWLLRQGETFEEGRARYEPFSRLVAEDVESREEIATLVAKAHAHGVPVFVLVDNKAEGCSPESIVRLARAIREKLEAAAPANRS